MSICPLDHEILDHAVKQDAVVEVTLDQLDEVVAMVRRLVIQFDGDHAFVGVDRHLRLFLLRRCSERTHAAQQGG